MLVDRATNCYRSYIVNAQGIEYNAEDEGESGHDWFTASSGSPLVFVFGSGGKRLGWTRDKLPVSPANNVIISNVEDHR